MYLKARNGNGKVPLERSVYEPFKFFFCNDSALGVMALILKPLQVFKLWGTAIHFVITKDSCN